jgi:nucleoside-diphosphate-sugar epimerase
MQRLLFVGCGDIALRAAPLLAPRYRLFGLVRTHQHDDRLRSRGITPLFANLDRPKSLARVSGIADVILHFAPPPGNGDTDPRTSRLLAALSKGRSLPRRLLYISTSGVYGDCEGAWVQETRPAAPATSRARRRLDAERRIRDWGKRAGVAVTILRVPGIYAADRLPLERLRKRTPALLPEEDAYSNHIHAEDLARIVVIALERGKPQRIYHAADGAPIKMGDYFDLVADAFNLPRPPRVSRAEAAMELPETLLSFLRESRKLDNTRLRRELKVALSYPSVAEGIAQARKESR